MAQLTDAQLGAEAQVIVNESNPGGNTKGRVGGVVQDLVDSKVSIVDPSSVAASQSDVNGESVTAKFLNPLTLAGKALPVGTYSTVLNFNTDQDVYHDATGASITFTLGSTNINGKGIILRLNKPTAITFPGNFEADSSSQTLDSTKLNVYFLVYFSNWNGSGTAHVIYKNSLYTSL